MDGPGVVLACGAGGDPVPTYADLARLLAAFHGLGDCPCELSGFIRSGPRARASLRRAGSPPGTVTSCGPAA